MNFIIPISSRQYTFYYIYLLLYTQVISNLSLYIVVSTSIEGHFEIAAQEARFSSNAKMNF